MQAYDYRRAGSVAEAVGAAAAGDGATRFIAGGTTLFDLMKLGAETPNRVIDVSAIRGLDGIDISRREVRIGSLARMSDVAAHERLNADYPALSESLWKAASQQIRNMATIGGNLLQRTRCNYFRTGAPFKCNKRVPGSGCSAIGGADRTLALLGASENCIANYPGDWAVALVAFDAVVDITGPSGNRTIPLEQMYREPGNTPHIENVLARGDFITHVRVPATRLGRASTYHKIRDRESYAFALTSAAVALEMDGNIVRDVRIALGGVAARPWRAREAERLLVGQQLTPATARAAGDLAFRGARPGRQNGFRIRLGAQTVADALIIARQKV